MIKKSEQKEKENIIKELKEKGYKNIFIWRDTKGTYYDWHTHPFNEIRYMLKGKMIINTKNKKYELNEGDFLEVNKNEPHEAYVLEDCEYICASK